MKTVCFLEILGVLMCFAGVHVRAGGAESVGVEITQIRDGVWLHVSGKDLGGNSGWVTSNGLLVREDDGLVLIDTAWGVQSTVELLEKIDRELRLPVRRAIVTHAHDDRLGGAAALVERGIPFMGHPLTAEFAPGFHRPAPSVIAGLETPGSVVSVGSLEVMFPGAGHTRDNIIVWIPSERILVGGCLIKAAGTRGLGYIEDADLAAWPKSVSRLQKRYEGDDILVVPGHGAPGGIELLQGTIDLMRKAQSAEKD